jgi:Ca-activated chloride channel family protein
MLVSVGSPTIRVDVALAHIPVSVTGPLGNPVSDLHREDFRLFEDGREQPIRYFSAQEAPVSIAILFDASGSMAPKLHEAREAVARLVRTSMHGDEYFLITFSDRARVITKGPQTPEEILRKLPKIHAAGWTALLDAADLGLRTLKSAANQRKALVILSDGADNRSRYTEMDLLRRIRESDTCIYALGLPGQDQSESNVRLLRELAQATGGLMLPVAALEELPAAVEQIAVNVRNQYLLGYSPAEPYDGRYRNVTVRLTRPESERLRASWRTGYYAAWPAATR